MTGTGTGHPASVEPRTPPPGLDVPAIRAAIHLTLHTRETPTEEEMVEREQLLLGGIEQLLPAAEAAVAKLWRGSVEWDQRRAQLDRIRDDVSRGLGTTPLSAHVHLRRLARHCTALLTYTEPAR